MHSIVKVNLLNRIQSVINVLILCNSMSVNKNYKFLRFIPNLIFWVTLMLTTLIKLSLYKFALSR